MEAYTVALVCLVLIACAPTGESMRKIVAVEMEAQGLTDEQTEQNVAMPFERVLGEIPGVQEVRSSSRSGGFCRIELEFASLPNQQTLQLVESVALAAWKKSAVKMATPHTAIQDRRIP